LASIRRDDSGIGRIFANKAGSGKESSQLHVRYPKGTFLIGVHSPFRERPRKVMIESGSFDADIVTGRMPLRESSNLPASQAESEAAKTCTLIPGNALTTASRLA
jgi:hypothetical protein